MTTPDLRKSRDRSPLRLGLLLIPLGLACFALAPQARAVDPPPDGGYTHRNTAEGTDALFNLDTSQAYVSDNTAIGFDALFSNTTGFGNTANGSQALYSNTTGGNNTADGLNVLYFNTTGSANTATGWTALQSNTTANFNTASGYAALYKNTTGEGNTANGALALFSNTIGVNNTASGFNALEFNSAGSANTATGFNALLFNISGNGNTATGSQALWGNAFGNDNTANGSSALFSNTSGSNNIAVGVGAGFHLTHGNNNIDIGSDVGGGGESRTIRIGTTPTHLRTFVAGISGVTVAGGVGVIVDTNGQLGTVVSSERFKDGIKPMDKASEAILALKPVTFRYKHELDPKGIPQFGLVAEEVEKVNPDLVARDEQGKLYTVRYEAVNAMLLNEFLKEHRKVAEQEATITELKAELRETATRQQKQIDALTASLQKVNAQMAAASPSHGELEASKRGTQTVVLNNR